jgi:hypothetical protein
MSKWMVWSLPGLPRWWIAIRKFLNLADKMAGARKNSKQLSSGLRNALSWKKQSGTTTFIIFNVAQKMTQPLF